MRGERRNRQRAASQNMDGVTEWNQSGSRDRRWRLKTVVRHRNRGGQPRRVQALYCPAADSYASRRSSDHRATPATLSGWPSIRVARASTSLVEPPPSPGRRPAGHDGRGRTVRDRANVVLTVHGDIGYRLAALPGRPCARWQDQVVGSAVHFTGALRLWSRMSGRPSEGDPIRNSAPVRRRSEAGPRFAEVAGACTTTVIR